MKNQAALIVGIVVFALSVPLLASAARDGQIPKPVKPDPVQGRKMAMKLCASCHMIGLDHVGNAQPGIPSFTYLAQKPGQTTEQLMIAMLHPFPPMIDTRLTIREIRDISAYILSLKQVDDKVGE